MNFNKFLVHILILSILNLSYCSHTKQLSGQDIEEKFKSGDKVNVKTKDGPRYKFILTEVSEDSIKGNNYSVATKDILTIERIYDDPDYSTLFKILIGIGVLVLIGKNYTAGPH